MILEVKRKFEVASIAGSEWELQAYEVTVWSFDSLTDTAVTTPVKCPKDFVPGLLKCYRNYTPLSVIEFDKELERIKWTRWDIKKAIEWKNA